MGFYESNYTQLLYGDVNEDGSIDILDLVMTVNYILGIQDFEDIQIYAADMNEDGTLNVLIWLSPYVSAN